MTSGISWHVRALAIRLRLGVPQAVNNLRQLAAYRSELGPGQFSSLLTQSTSEPELVEAILSLLDKLDEQQGTSS